MRVCHWLHLSPSGGEQNDNPATLRGREEKISWRGREQLTISIIAASRTPPSTAAVFWEDSPWPVLTCTIRYPCFFGRFWCLMWNEVDLIWGKKESDTLVLQLSQERNESAVCGWSACVRMCVCVRRQWKMAGNKHFWHTGAPIHIQLKGFLGISHILIPLVHILEPCLHLWECLLWIFNFIQCLRAQSQILFSSNTIHILSQRIQSGWDASETSVWHLILFLSWTGKWKSDTGLYFVSYLIIFAVLCVNLGSRWTGILAYSLV